MHSTAREGDRMPCPNDHRERSVIISFRATPSQAEWLDKVVAESCMTKQDFIMSRLQDEAITVMPNVRLYKALKGQLEDVRRELARLSSSEEVNDRLLDDIERLTDVMGHLKGDYRDDGSQQRPGHRETFDDLMNMSRF